MIDYEPEKPNRASVYPATPDFKAAVSRVLDEGLLSDKILDGIWNNIFYYRTVFEDVAIDIKTCTPGSGLDCPSTGVDPDGLILVTEAATTGNFADVDKTPLAESGLNWSKRARLRIGFRVPSIAAQTVYMIRGSQNISSPYYGFKITNATLMGVTYDKTTEKTVTLQTIVASTSYLVEARYSPSDKVVFLVDGVEKGVITSNLINPQDSVKRAFYNFRITTNENVGKTLIIAFLEYIQLKSKT